MGACTIGILDGLFVGGNKWIGCCVGVSGGLTDGVEEGLLDGRGVGL